MTSFGPDDADLHDRIGNHRPRPRGEGAHWNARMEAHIQLHVRRDKVIEAAPKGGNMWELGTHVPRQLRTPLAES